MAINFPSSPTNGQKFTSGTTVYTYSTATASWQASPLGTALPFNYIINPCFQISQQNARTTGTVSSYYAADQWLGAANNAGGAGWLIRFASNAVVTPNGSPYMLSSITFGGGTDVAGNYICIIQNIEGNRIADLQYGTANAKWSVLSFWVRNAVSRDYTYAVTIRNGAANRSISWPLVIPSLPTSAFYYFAISVPPDTTGTWPKDNSVAMNIIFTTYCNANLRAPTAGVWTAGNYLGVTGMVNDIVVTPGTFLFGDVGLYADPNQTGRAPPWESVGDRQVHFDCQRYYQKCMTTIGVAIANTSTPQRSSFPSQATMRIVPVSTFTATMRGWDQATAPNITAILTNYCNKDVFEFNYTSASAQTAGRAAMLIDASPTIFIAQNARM